MVRLRRPTCCAIVVMVMHFVASAEDLPCLDKTTRQIAIDPGSSNAYKLMTVATGHLGYTAGLVCRWNLQVSPSSSAPPLQLALNVTGVDFDFNNVSSAAAAAGCVAGAADIFRLQVNGYITIGTNWLRNLTWCSNSMALQMGELIVLPMWDKFSSIAVDFHADGQQQRTDARGIVLEAWTLKPGYCERQLLYSAGWCYFVSARRLNFSEAWEAGRYAAGELAGFASAGELAGLLKDNENRKGLFPYASPLDFSLGDLWLGNFASQEGEVYASTLQSACQKRKAVDFVVTRPPPSESSPKSSSSSSSSSSCFLTLTPAAAAAAAASSSSAPAQLHCEPADTRLRALLRFRLLEPPASMKAAAAPPSDQQRQPDRETFTPASCPTPRQVDAGPTRWLTKLQLLLIGGASLFGIAILLVAAALLCVQRRRRNRDVASVVDVNGEDDATTTATASRRSAGGSSSGGGSRSSGRRSWTHRNSGVVVGVSSGSNAVAAGGREDGGESVPLKSS